LSSRQTFFNGSWITLPARTSRPKLIDTLDMNACIDLSGIDITKYQQQFFLASTS
jgi:hypothetical protein